MQLPGDITPDRTEAVFALSDSPKTIRIPIVRLQVHFFGFRDEVQRFVRIILKFFARRFGCDRSPLKFLNPPPNFICRFSVCRHQVWLDFS